MKKKTCSEANRVPQLKTFSKMPLPLPTKIY